MIEDLVALAAAVFLLWGAGQDSAHLDDSDYPDAPLDRAFEAGLAIGLCLPEDVNVWEDDAIVRSCVQEHCAELLAAFGRRIIDAEVCR